MDDLDDLETVDCYDDEDDACDLEQLTPELAYVHEWARRRTSLDRHAERFGLEAVNTLCAKALAQTAELAQRGVRIAAVPEELSRFMEADDAYWVHLLCGLWYNETDVCGATWRDDLSGTSEWCLLAPHDRDQPHGFLVAAGDGTQRTRPAPVAF